MAIILYHANCNDGKGAALAAHIALRDTGHRYIPVQYDAPPPWHPDATHDLTADDVRGQHLYILDFSYPADTIIDACALFEHVTVIDHHKTAIAELDNRSLRDRHDLTLVLDTAHSGAVLAWHHFHGSPPPALFQYIDDRDRWAHRFTNSNNVALGLIAHSPDFRAWEPLLHSKAAMQDIIATGRAIDSYLTEQQDTIRARLHTTTIHGHDNVPIINCPAFLASNTLHAILAADDNLDYPFAASYFDLPADDKRIYSLRSTDNRIDVGAIANLMGGGGHRNAAGFSIPIPMLNITLE